MPVKLVPKSQNDVTLALRALFIKTEQELINTIKRKKNLNQVDYAETAALMRVQQTLNQMVAKSNEYVPKMVERIFYETAKDFSGYTNATSLTVAQTGAVDVIVNNLLGEVEEMAQNATQSAREVLTVGRLEADKYRQAGLISVAEKEAAGASWRTAAERMNQRLQAEGITCFVDKAGRKWSMNAYGNMVARTTARQAQVAAVLTADDHDLYQIAKIGSTCPICAVYEGRVYSKSGNNPEYPPLAMAFGKIDPLGSNDLSNTYLNIHPNCLHTLMKYTTIGLTDKQIQRDKDFSSFEKNPATHDPRTKKQIEAYKEKERNRQKLRRELKKKEEAKIKSAAMTSNASAKMSTNLRTVNPETGRNYISDIERKEVAKYGEDNGIKFSNLRDFDGKIETLKDAVDDANKVIADFSEFTKRKNKLIIELSGKLPTVEHASTRGHEISLNSNNFGNIEWLKADYAMSAKDGWFVPGTDYHSIIYHEMGHVVANIYGIDGLSIACAITKKNEEETLKYLYDTLSQYSAKYVNGQEIIAEVFSDYYGKQSPTPFTLQFMKTVFNIVNT